MNKKVYQSPTLTILGGINNSTLGKGDGTVDNVLNNNGS